MIRCLNITKTYDKDNCVFKSFDYNFLDNGLYVLFGDSGCGKTTLLNIICGLTSMDEGEIFIGNKTFKGCVNNNVGMRMSRGRHSHPPFNRGGV